MPSLNLYYLKPVLTMVDEADTLFTWIESIKLTPKKNLSWRRIHWPSTESFVADAHEDFLT